MTYTLLCNIGIQRFAQVDHIKLPLASSYIVPYRLKLGRYLTLGDVYVLLPLLFICIVYPAGLLHCRMHIS